jgi:hypothetical protein
MAAAREMPEQAHLHLPLVPKKSAAFALVESRFDAISRVQFASATAAKPSPGLQTEKSWPSARCAGPTPILQSGVPVYRITAAIRGIFFLFGSLMLQKEPNEPRSAIGTLTLD